MSREAYFILLDKVKVPREGEDINSSKLFVTLNPQLYKDDEDKTKQERNDKHG